MELEYKSVLDKVIALTKSVGVFIKTEGEAFKREDIEYKGLNDLVSYVDKGAEKQLVSELKKIIPEAGFITEEKTEDNTRKDLTWIIDPLDGTTNFTHGLPVFAISIALLEKDEIVLGVVYEINREECFYSIQGDNAYCNGEKISVSSEKDLSGSLLATGFPYYDFDRMQDYLKILNEFMESTHGLRRMGSAAVDLAYVACGRFEGFFEYNLNSWDVAAGAFIVEQAGGRVSDFSGGNDFLFGRQIVASGKVHDKLLGVITNNWN